MNETNQFSYIAEEDNHDDEYRGVSIEDIIRREAAHQVPAEQYLCNQKAGGQEFGSNTDDQHLLDFTKTLQLLYDRLMANDEAPTKPLPKGSGLKLTKLGIQIVNACGIYAMRQDEGRDWQTAYADHTFHPVFGVMLGAVYRWWSPISCVEPSAALLMAYEGDRQCVEALSHFVDFIRPVCSSQAFKNLLHDRESKANSNFRSGVAYLKSVFKRHARVLVVRVDLYYRPDGNGSAYGEVANKALSNYVRLLRSGRAKTGYLGVLVKRENGISRGMHFHLMVLFDGDLRRNAYYLTQELGEAWMKRVGEDRGSFFNCYALKDRYLYNGLGLVHVNDWEKLLGLRIALWYITKQDCVLDVGETKVQNFTRSEINEGDSKRGAPRKNADSMALVKRALSGVRSKYPRGYEPPKSSHSRLQEALRTNFAGSQ
jgi:hypothetical protein